jgi:septum formation protein
MPDSRIKLILASRSPRRRELLAAAGYAFEIVEPSESAECSGGGHETTVELVERLALQKASDVALRLQNRMGTAVAVGKDRPKGNTFSRQPPPSSLREGKIILGCDTVAECEGKILGKPVDRKDARRMLETLSGREHRVLSGLCLWPIPDGRPNIRSAVTRLRMDLLAPRQLDEYLASDLWAGKAGAFGYQDGIDWVHVVEGSESNVVGLPMELLAEMLENAIRNLYS